jgi:hypothetical protein
LDNNMTVIEKIKLQEAYQKVLHESMGDIVNAGLRTMANGSPMVIAPFKNGTDKIKSSDELQREQKNNAIAGAVGLAAGAAVVNPAATAMVGKAALRGLNAYSNYELIKDLYNDAPYATTAAGVAALTKPKAAYKIGNKILNGKYGWAVPAVYYLGKGFKEGLDSANSNDGHISVNDNNVDNMESNTQLPTSRNVPNTNDK